MQIRKLPEAFPPEEVLRIQSSTLGLVELTMMVQSSEPKLKL